MLKNVITNNIVIIIFIFILSVCKTSNAEELKNYYNVKYIGNYDGDTVSVEFKIFKKGKTEFIVRDDVRIRNLNTPEVKTRNIEEKKAGLAAKVKLKNILLKAKQIDLKKCEREKYGRMLCEVWVDGVDLINKNR